MTEVLPVRPDASADLAPPRLSEIVVKTSNFDAMRDWYQLVLSAQLTLEYDVPGGGAHSDNRTSNFHRLCFLRVYWEFPYTEVLALFEIPGLSRIEEASGLHHMQFRCATLDALIERHDRLAPYGITPYRSYNHGPSISFYYQDPDGNLVELSGPNFSSETAYRDFFASEGFARNPTGVEIRTEDFLAAYRSGMDRDELVRFP